MIKTQVCNWMASQAGFIQAIVIYAGKVELYKNIKSQEIKSLNIKNGFAKICRESMGYKGDVLW